MRMSFAWINFTETGLSWSRLCPVYYVASIIVGLLASVAASTNDVTLTAAAAAATAAAKAATPGSHVTPAILDAIGRPTSGGRGRLAAHDDYYR